MELQEICRNIVSGEIITTGKFTTEVKGNKIISLAYSNNGEYKIICTPLAIIVDTLFLVKLQIILQFILIILHQ